MDFFHSEVNKTSTSKLLKRLIIATLVVFYLLIFIGSMVRATGSGMGCPDWPTCFGQLIPPTSIDEVPVNYQELYPYYQNAKFNAFHTWTEYFNRLSGVSVGFLLFITWIVSLINLKKQAVVTKSITLAFILTCFQGWLGSVVVGTHLSPMVISIHMFFAQLIGLILIYSFIKSLNFEPIKIISHKIYWLYSAIGMLTVQMLFGLLTRQKIDAITNENILPKEVWVDHLTISFDLHQMFSIITVSLISFAALNLLKQVKGATEKAKIKPIKLIEKIAISSLAVVFVLFVVGISLIRFDFPFLLQPIHLTLASILLGLCFALILLTKKSSS